MVTIALDRAFYENIVDHLKMSVATDVPKITMCDTADVVDELDNGFELLYNAGDLGEKCIKLTSDRCVGETYWRTGNDRTRTCWARVNIKNLQ